MARRNNNPGRQNKTRDREAKTTSPSSASDTKNGKSNTANESKRGVVVFFLAALISCSAIVIRQMDELQLDQASTEVYRDSKDDTQVPQHKAETKQLHSVRTATIEPLQHAQKTSPDHLEPVKKTAPKAPTTGEEKLQLYLSYGLVSLGANLMGFSLAVWLGEKTEVVGQRA